MRIGEFAQKHNLTIDTVRHYMDLELLLPNKKGGHYFFGQKEIDDLKKILELKELKFTLAEIQRVITYTRLSQLRTKEDKNYIRKIFSSKQSMLEEEKEEIKKALNILKHRINEIDQVDRIDKGEFQEVKMGIPLSFLQHFSCPTCNIPLELEDGKIASNMIIEGYFKCGCGYSGNVEDGIYISLDEEDRKKIKDENPENKVKIANTLGEYVDGTEPTFTNHIYKSIDTIINFIEVNDIDNKIILELGTGSGFFIRQFLSYIKPTNTYIITEHEINRLMEIKEYLEDNRPTGKFVFICSDLDKIPIKNEIVDYSINYMTSITYNLSSDKLLESVIIPKVKIGGKLIGCIAYVKSGSKLLLSIPPAYRKFYEEKAYKKEIQSLELNFIILKELYSLEVEAKSEPMLKGSEIHALAYCGER